MFGRIHRIVLAALLLYSTSHALDFGGQIRPRFEFLDPAAGGGDDSFTSMRTRAHLGARLDRGVSAFIQWQDVRLLGEETNTLGDFSADRFDMHLGYVQFEKLYGRPLDLWLGRQETSLGGQRLIGAVGWKQQARAFDGLRLQTAPRGIHLDLIGFRLADATAPTHDDNAYLAGAYATLQNIRDLELYLFYNSAGAATDQFTLGLRQAGKAGRFPYRVEGSFQTGQRLGEDVAALMVGLRAGTSLGKGALTLWFDYLSGDDDPTDGETRVFDTLFGTNHKFYGYADYFLNIPVHTRGGGLQDLALKLSWPLGPVQLKADLHQFSLAEKGGLESGRLGEELDLVLSHRYSKEVRCSAGFSYVRAADAFAAIGRLDDDAIFSFLMVDTQF